MAEREISIEDMSEEQRFAIFTNAIGGTDPLELIIELEQLALDCGYSDVHTFIEHQLILNDIQFAH
jgi:hypothetical protein